MKSENVPPRLYDGNFVIAIAAQTCFVLANAMMAHYARFISHLGGDDQQIGWITGAGVVAGLLLRPWMGPWIDRLGARTTWAVGYAIYLTAALGNLLLTELGPAIVLLRIGTELGTALSFASGVTYITQTAPPQRRTEAIGTLGAGGFLGMIIGPAAGDWILGEGARSHTNFAWMFATISASVALGAVLVAFLRKPADLGFSGPVHLREFVATSRRYWPGTVLLVVLMFGICTTVPFIFLSRYVDHLGLEGGIGHFFFVYAGWGLLLRLGLRELPDRLGRGAVLMIGLGGMAAGMISFAFVDADRSWVLLLSALICGTAHALIFHPMMGLALDSFPDQVRGAGSVLALIAMDMGRFVGGPALGSIAYYLGFEWMFAFVALSAVATMVCFQLSLRRPSPDAAHEDAVHDWQNVDGETIGTGAA